MGEMAPVFHIDLELCQDEIEKVCRINGLLVREDWGDWDFYGRSLRRVQY
jgi:hypothetical protein